MTASRAGLFRHRVIHTNSHAQMEATSLVRRLVSTAVYRHPRVRPDGGCLLHGSCSIGLAALRCLAHTPPFSALLGNKPVNRNYSKANSPGSRAFRGLRLSRQHTSKPSKAAPLKPTCNSPPHHPTHCTGRPRPESHCLVDIVHLSPPETAPPCACCPLHPFTVPVPLLPTSPHRQHATTAPDLQQPSKTPLAAI